MSEEILLRELDVIRDEIVRAGAAPWKTARVVAVDRDAQTADLELVHGDLVIPAPGISLNGDFIPDVGADVLVLLGETAPAILPGSSPGSIASRGRYESIVGRNEIPNVGFESPDAERMPNGNFEVDTRGWQAGANSIISQSGAQAHSGTKSLSVVAVAGGTIRANTWKDSPSGFAPVEEQRRYLVVPWIRSATTGRSGVVYTQFLDASFATIGAAVAHAFPADSSVAWSSVKVYETSPAGAAWLQVYVDWASAVAGETHYLDDVSVIEAVAGWDAGVGAQVWTFDATTESWTGLNASVSQITGANPSPIAGTGALAVSSTAALGFGASSPQGAAGVPSVAGFKHAVSGWARAATTSRTLTLTMRFWNGAAANGTRVFAGVPVDTSGWFELPGWDATGAPAGTTTVSVEVMTNAGAISEVFYLDSVLVTKPTITNVETNTDPTYVRSGSKSMMMTLTAAGVASVLAPPGQDALYSIPVVPGDTWKVEAWYKNHASNAARRAVIVVASWYSSTGTFLGMQLGTYPRTTPGAGWTPASERFLVPTGAASLRANVVWIGASGDRMAIDDVVVAIDSKITGKLIPQGSIETVDIRSNEVPSYMLSLPAGVYTVSAPIQVANPMQPVRFFVQVLGGLNNSLAGFVRVRVDISLDGGLSWDPGQEFKGYLDTPGGLPAAKPFVSSHEVTGMPTDNILYRFGVKPDANAATDVGAVAITAVMLPAPPAGRQ